MRRKKKKASLSFLCQAPNLSQVDFVYLAPNSGRQEEGALASF